MQKAKLHLAHVSPPRKPATRRSAALVVSGVLAVGVALGLASMEVSRRMNTLHPGDDTRLDNIASYVKNSSNPQSYVGQAMVLPKAEGEPMSTPDTVVAVRDTNTRGCIQFELYRIGSIGPGQKFLCPTP